MPGLKRLRLTVSLLSLQPMTAFRLMRNHDWSQIVSWARLTPMSKCVHNLEMVRSRRTDKDGHPPCNVRAVAAFKRATERESVGNKQSTRDGSFATRKPAVE